MPVTMDGKRGNITVAVRKRTATITKCTGSDPGWKAVCSGSKNNDAEPTTGGGLTQTGTHAMPNYANAVREAAGVDRIVQCVPPAAVGNKKDSRSAAQHTYYSHR